MRLQRMLIRGFGQLRGEIRLESGANTVALVLDRNEAGKSTLAAAIVAALYGLESDRRRARGAKVEQDLYRPWAGGPYGLSLTLEVAGRELVVDRDFERGSVRVLEGATDVTDRFQVGSRIAVGEKLTGLRREQFLLSTFVGQGDIVWNDAGGLTEALQRVADSQGGRATASAAVATLDAALTHYDGLTLAGTGRVETEIERCRRTIEESESALTELDAQHASHGARIERLRRDDLLAHRDAQQREILRARRLRTEANAIEELLTHDGDLQHRVQAAEDEVQRAGDLERYDSATAAQLDGLRRKRELSLGELEREEATADRSAEERAEAVATRDALGLTRRPTQDDIDRLWQASVRHDDAEQELQRLESRLGDAERELATRGYRLDRAQALARHFEDLQEEDRVRLSGRTQECVRIEERRAANEEQYARERQREATIRRGRSTLRRAGWVVTGLAVALAAAILLVASQLPLSILAIRAIAVALLVVGPVLVAASTRRGRRELADCRAIQRQLEEAQVQLTEDEAELEMRWKQLAHQVGVPAEELEAEYREFRTVEVSARNAASLQARVKDLDRAQVTALEESSALDALFDERDRSRTIADKLKRLREAVAIYSHADQVAAIADAARQRVEIAKNSSRQAESTLRQALRDAGIEISATDTIASGFERLSREVDVLRQARQLRDEVLPALRQRLLDPLAREEQGRLLETLRSEGMRLQQSITEHMQSLGLDVSQLEATLAQPLSQSEFDEKWQHQREQEEKRHREREVERTQVHAFLSRYEKEAPARRASIETHRRALERAEQFRDAVTLARNTLEEIGRETHRTWSVALNRHCGEVLRGLHSRAEHVSFDEDLSLRLEQEGQQLTGQEATQHLSAGALDAIYLAARIAVSRFLSGGGESLPLVLDDPFANADDARLLSGLRLLLDQIAPGQQILLMACQRSRYQWAAGELGDPPALVAIDVATNIDPAPGDDEYGTHRARA